MKKTISLVLVLALGLTAKVANADFTFGTPTNLGLPVNSSYGEYDPSISTDGLLLFFNSQRPGGSGGSDIWVATRVTTRVTTDTAWGPPENLGPSINTVHEDYGPSISDDGLELYFCSDRPGGSGGMDLYVTKRATIDDPWQEPVNLGPTVNSLSHELNPAISADSLSLFFADHPGGPFRSGGHGRGDIWVTKRKSENDDWETPVNLGPVINSSAYEGSPSIWVDGLLLFFDSYRPPGRIGVGVYNSEIWVTRRATKNDDWQAPIHLGPGIHSTVWDGNPEISADGSILYFASERPAGVGNGDIWQAFLFPVVDFNGDGIVDSADMCIMVDYWGTDEPLCDIGPMPWGDGIVDVQDLIVLAEHLFEGIPPVEPEEVNVDEGDADSQVELEQGQILVVTLELNPTTGYRWEVVETQESILQQMGEAEFKQSETGGPPLVGAGGWEIFRFKAVSAGQTSLKLVYHRPWEEGVEPLKTFTLQVVVR